MRGVITKCLIEMNTQKMFEEAASLGSQKSSAKSESSDQAANDTWLESQIICDRVDVHMNDEESADVQLSDFEYDGDGRDDKEQLEDIDRIE